MRFMEHSLGRSLLRSYKLLSKTHTSALVTRGTLRESQSIASVLLVETNKVLMWRSRGGSDFGFNCVCLLVAGLGRRLLISILCIPSLLVASEAHNGAYGWPVRSANHH